jgi:hypothetical protein
MATTGEDMRPIQSLIPTALFALTAASAHADDSLKLPDWSAYSSSKPQAEVAAAALVFTTPKVGIRLGVGHWDEGMAGIGADVTFKVPFLPIPGLRLDAEAWSRLSDLGGNLRGNAISLLGIQTFTLAYAGIGPTFWFTSDHGDHESGFGAKLLVGLTLPKGFYVEASTILGPHPAQGFIWAGMRF